VLPERVSQDLPKAVAIIREAGLETPMVTAGIADTESPHAEEILRTLSRLGIRYYRWGNFRYRDGESIQSQLDKLRPRVEALAKLNARYGVCAMYHTHSGPGQVGASIWDIYQLVNGLDPKAVGINLDIAHATVEGGHGGWIASTRLVSREYLRGTALKDFYWGRNAKGEWTPQWCALGQGMVNFRRYFAMLKESGFRGPVQLHFEYPELGGANDGKTSMSITKEQFVSILKRDLAVARSVQNT
jgi:sugar phosphate isomerase/epimerase